MMKMIKLIATDMDGTLLNLFHTTDLYVLETINKINESDVALCFATARHMHKHMLKRLGLMSKHFFTIGMNGAIIKDDRGNILRMSPIDKDTLSALIDNLPIKDFMFFDENNSYTTLSRNEFKGAMFKSIRRLVNTFSDYGLNLDNIVFSVTKDCHLFLRQVKIVHQPLYRLTFVYIFINNIDTDKTAGCLGYLLSLQELFNLSDFLLT